MLRRAWEATKDNYRRLSTRHRRLYGSAAVIAGLAFFWFVYSLIRGRWGWALLYVLFVAGLYGLFWLDGHKTEVQSLDDLDKL